MEVTSLPAIISSLMLYISAAMQIPDGQIPTPEVKFLTEKQMEVKFCGGKSCGSLLGMVPKEDGAVYLKDTLDVQRDMEARGILLHELVHYVQYKRNSPTLPNDCLTWKAREVEAYRIQHNWLYDNRVPISIPTYNIALVNFQSLRCPRIPSDHSASEPPNQ